ncbi:MAG: hypothetical protein K2M34_02955 [Alphaproteobacteria bacterium]|nr:hypothetical protein [Alphaproteobacteria bacterium]
MKKTQLIIVLAAIFITVSHTKLYADACTNLGATTGATCYTGNLASTNIRTATNCTSASSGCTYKACSNTCRCISTACPSNTTNCSSTTCNPIWGDIDSSTHIQTGTNREPDTSNNCKCENQTDINGKVINVYRCASGYYDTKTGIQLIGGKPSCEQCPSLGNNNVPGQSNTGVTSNPANKGITSCYIPYNTEITDNTGTYIFYKTGILATSGGCSYSNIGGTIDMPQLPMP